MCGFDLMFDLKTREQWHVVAVMFNQRDFIRHDDRHEMHGLFVDVSGINKNFADFVVEVIANCAYHQITFEVDQEWGRVQPFGLACVSRAFGGFFVLRFGRAIDGFPQLHQVIQIPFQFFGFAADGSGTCNHAHPARDFELIDDVAQLAAIFALDAARYAATARVVRHQHQVAARQTDEGG